MDRAEKEFLIGFERAARLTRQVRERPPTHTSAEDYMKEWPRSTLPRTTSSAVGWPWGAWRPWGESEDTAPDCGRAPTQ